MWLFFLPCFFFEVPISGFFCRFFQNICGPSRDCCAQTSSARILSARASLCTLCTYLRSLHPNNTTSVDCPSLSQQALGPSVIFLSPTNFYCDLSSFLSCTTKKQQLTTYHRTSLSSLFLRLFPRSSLAHTIGWTEAPCNIPSRF